MADLGRKVIKYTTLDPPYDITGYKGGAHKFKTPSVGIINPQPDYRQPHVIKYKPKFTIGNTQEY